MYIHTGCVRLNVNAHKWHTWVCRIKLIDIHAYTPGRLSDRHDLAPWYQVIAPSTWNQLPGTEDLLLESPVPTTCTKHLVPISWYHILVIKVIDIKYLVPNTWYQPLGSKILCTYLLVPSTWYQTLGTKNLIPRPDVESRNTYEQDLTNIDQRRLTIDQMLTRHDWSKYFFEKTLLKQTKSWWTP